jgi:uncharacterized phage-associated protein
MASALDVAKYFISFNTGGEDDDISNMKLQKLLYFAQGHSLARFGEPLFRDPIEAWEHGPVVRDVYVKYRGYGNRPIMPEPGDTRPDFGEDGNCLLWNVLCEYGQFSASKLRDMTHEQGRAWDRVYREGEKRVVDVGEIALDFEDAYLDGEPNADTLETIREYEESKRNGTSRSMTLEEYFALVERL